ncbi:MAG: DNA mismatch repair endonuclease MutL [Gammaproteobacteria bacterium]|nr:DNA mismatch repair endonuclease MutL [Gammaproteobacteria bacterium]
MQALRPIRPLSDHLINQIAAGEVVERPASVVKELVENSLDAGATRIDIDVGDGGLAYMTVSDDGSGMAGEDLGAALRRHWTSKIAEVSDLASLSSLGFRGEALASIASVANIEIVTRRRSDAHGWRLTVAPGQAPAAPQPHKANVGTRITVSELFHNVPARRRFLKRARTEFLHIQQLVRQLAFARPDVAMSLSQAGSRGLRLSPAALGADAARWRSLFGSAFAAAAHYVTLDVEGVSVRGWVGGAAQADSQSDSQFLSLNGRYVRDRQLAHAVRLAYGEAIPAGRFPVYALAVAVAPSAVDVNVHPGKLEVRFADVRAVHDVLYVAVRRALEGEPAAQLADNIAETARDYAAPHAAPAIVSRAAPPASATVAAQLGTPLALIDDLHLLFRAGEHVYALDLRRAWRRVLASRLAVDGVTPVATRPLLIPERIASNATLWRRCSPAMLSAQGFELDDLGPAGQLLRAVPRVLPELSWSKFFEVLFNGLAAADTHDLRESCAHAAAMALELGSHGQPSRRLLEQLEQGAAAGGVALLAMAKRVDGELLAQADVPHD